MLTMTMMIIIIFFIFWAPQKILVDSPGSYCGLWAVRVLHKVCPASCRCLLTLPRLSLYCMSPPSLSTALLGGIMVICLMLVFVQSESIWELILCGGHTLTNQGWKPIDLCSVSPPMGFQSGSVVKNPPINAGGLGSSSGSGRPPGEGNSNPLQYSCLGTPADRGTWQATVHGVTKESDMT